MPKMNTSSQKVLKITPLFFVCLWVGGAITLALLKLGVHPDNGSALHGFDLTRTFIDDFIVIPGAVGCLLTGLVYSIFTGFGFFKLRWVAVKWVITIAGILFGTFWLISRKALLLPICCTVWVLWRSWGHFMMG